MSITTSMILAELTIVHGRELRPHSTHLLIPSSHRAQGRWVVWTANSCDVTCSGCSKWFNPINIAADVRGARLSVHCHYGRMALSVPKASASSFIASPWANRAATYLLSIKTLSNQKWTASHIQSAASASSNTYRRHFSPCWQYN
jgi:hypothetical protein